jgi:hypothetical protein
MKAPSRKAHDSGAKDFLYAGLRALAGNMPDWMLMDHLEALGRPNLGRLELIEEAGDDSQQEMSGGIDGNIQDIEERITGDLQSGAAKHVFVPMGRHNERVKRNTAD